MKIFSGSSNQQLAKRICQNLNLPMGDVFLKAFPSGERYCQFQENIRGSDVFLVQSTSMPVNDYLMELLVMADAARRASAGRITAVVPYFGYARQDRKDKSRVPISAKLVMNMFQAAGINRILTMDLHSGQSVGFTDSPVDQLGFKPVLINTIKDLDIECVVAPDIGAVKRAEEYASEMKKDLAIISKIRHGDTEVEVKHFIGNVKGKKVIIIDDLTESSSTLVEAAIACQNKGAKEIYAAVSHGCFTDIGYQRIAKAIRENLIKKVFFSNSIFDSKLYIAKSIQVAYVHPYDVQAHCDDTSVTVYANNNQMEIVDISTLFSQAIEHIHNNKSVSQLFK